MVERTVNKAASRFDGSISIIIPAFNEQAAIGSTLESLLGEPRLSGAEIIVIDDGSSDQTGQVIDRYRRVRKFTHRVNLGYGASVSTGMRQSSRPFVIWFDSDGQHQVEDLIRLARTLVEEDLDYCIGVRQAGSDQVARRMIGKSILRSLVQFTSRRQITDFNCGLRGFKREVILHYLHLLPKGFSASTTTTLIMYERNHIGQEIPVTTRKRVGTSTVKGLRDGSRTMLIILRILLLFKPFLFFGSIGSIMILLGAVYGLIQSLPKGQSFPVLGSLLIIAGFQILIFGVQSDQLSQLRRERFEK